MKLWAKSVQRALAQSDNNMNNENPEITLVFTLAEVNVISTAISELKLKDGIDVFMKLREQTVKQLQPAAVDQVPEDVKLPV